MSYLPFQMVLVNMCVGWVPRRSMDTNQLQHSSRTWTSSPCLLIRFEAHFPVSSSQHFKLMYMSSSISDGTREHVCRLGTQTLDGHQPTTDSSRTWTSSPCLLIRFEAHFPVSSSQHFKLMYMSSSISDGTREHVCRLGTQTLDGHQPTTDSSRTWTSSPCLLIRFEAHFPVSSSQHFKLMYMSSSISDGTREHGVGWVPRRSMDTNQPQILQGHGPPHPAYSSDLRHTSQFPHHSTSNLCTCHLSISDGTREHVCRLGTQTLDGHQPTTDSSRHGPPHPAYSSDLRHTSQFPHHSTSNLCTCHLSISDGTREHVCRLGTQTLDGHQPTTDSSRTWTSSPCLLIGFEAHFPVSSSQHFKLMYMSSSISDGTRELVCRLGTQTLDGHQPTTDSSRTWTSSPCLLIGFEAHFPVSSSQHFKLMYMSSLHFRWYS